MLGKSSAIVDLFFSNKSNIEMERVSIPQFTETEHLSLALRDISPPTPLSDLDEH